MLKIRVHVLGSGCYVVVRAKFTKWKLQVPQNSLQLEMGLL